MKLREAAEAVVEVLGHLECSQCGHLIKAHMDQYGCEVDLGDSDAGYAIGPCGCAHFQSLFDLRSALAEENGRDKQKSESWSDCMAQIQPCGHTEAQHQDYLAGAVKLDTRCDVMDAFDGRKLAEMVLEANAVRVTGDSWIAIRRQAREVKGE